MSASLQARYAAALRSADRAQATRLSLVREALTEAGSVLGASRLLGVDREHVRSLLSRHPEIAGGGQRGRGRPAGGREATAPEGQFWLCTYCGWTGKDRSGRPGCCRMRAILGLDGTLTRDEDGWVSVVVPGEVETIVIDCKVDV